MLMPRDAEASEIEKTGLIYKVYLPKELDGPRPLLVLVHGRAGNAQVPWIFSSTVQRQKPIVIAPQAPDEDAIGGFSWWQVEAKPNEESSSPESSTTALMKPAVKTLEAFIDSLPEIYPIDTSLIYAAGFSQGGAVVGTLSLLRPEMFRGVAILSSFLPRAVFDDRELVDQSVLDRRALLPDYFIAHGTKDEVIRYARAEHARDTLEQLGASVEFCSDDVGHKVGPNSMKALKSWFETQL